MQKNDLFWHENDIFRVLNFTENKAFVINCTRQTMPQWYDNAAFDNWTLCNEQDFQKHSGVVLPDIDFLSPSAKRIMHERYTIVAGVLPFLHDSKLRNTAISRIADNNGICKQTVRNYLCLYLAYQDITALAPKCTIEDKPLSQDEKNMRWSLNKFFYNQRKNSLTTAYTFMLKEKYSDSMGNLYEHYPTFNQFRYYYQKNRKMQTYYISRNGLKNYQRNNRPLLGNGVQEFAPSIGVGMLDSTICDIYLVDEGGNLIGRPLLDACIDAYSGLCCGYVLSWEGGVYSLRGLMANVICDKVALCKRHGISITKEAWNCNRLPATLVTDMGSEYKSANFEQIAELGVTVINLPPYRPELKGSVEKFFDLIQSYYKPYLKGKGVIEPDYQERGAHDYRKDACLTLQAFEKVLLYCIIHYNSKRIIERFPYSEDMLEKKVPPHSSDIWNYSMTQPGANLIPVDREQLLLTLLPRVTGTFTRHGLKVNQLHYTNSKYTESFLRGSTTIVSYNPDDVSSVWVNQNGSYDPFELIETRFNRMDLSAVEAMQAAQKAIVKSAEKDYLQAKVHLSEQISTIANNANSPGHKGTNAIRQTRNKAQRNSHVDYMKAGAADV